MTGGSATHAGIGFQDRVAGLLSVHVVADAPVDFFGLPSDVTPTSIELETSAPVDDILVATSAAGFCFINVKKGVTLSQKSDSPLGSVLDLFKGSPIDHHYQDSEFLQVRHLLVPKLTDDELEQVWSKSQLMANAYEQGTGTLRELLRSPFNLFLLANVLASGLREFRDITTQLQLLHLYWSYRVVGTDRRGLLREGLLKVALGKMLDERTLQASVQELSATTDDLDRLLSEGVLTPAEGTRDHVVRISFAHHVLFDYGVARLILESGLAGDFVSRLTSSDDRALSYA